MNIRSSPDLMMFLLLLLSASIFIPAPAHAEVCTRATMNVSDPNTGQSWSTVSKCHNTGGATMYLGANNSTPVANMDSTYSWFVCWFDGEQHEGGNNIWYYSQGDRGSHGAWGYMKAWDVSTSNDPGDSNLPKCAPDMWQKKLSVSDPNTGRSWSTVWYAGNNGGVPLYKDAGYTTQVAIMDSTTSWFACYVRDASDSIWYYTQGDRSIPGWESRQTWGFMSAAQVHTRRDPYDAIPACNFAPPSNTDYSQAMAQAFGSTPSLASRVVVNTGVTTGDDGLLVMRWFIPSPGAAGGTLLGDDRGFSNLPSAADHSRIVVAWDVATGRVSITVNASTLPSGFDIQALPISVKSACGFVQSTDLAKRSTNDVFVGSASSGILELCVSALNSLTNSIDAASWSVDSSWTIKKDPNNPGVGNYFFSMLGNGYPAIEATYYGRTGGARTAFRRRVDPFVSRDVDAGGGFAALDLVSWYRCLTPAASPPPYASLCFWDTSITPPQGVDVRTLYYFTSWTESGIE